MEYRTLGNTDLRVSALGFGCGAIGGLMVLGDQPTRLRAVERAVEAGITYFDTAHFSYSYWPTQLDGFQRAIPAYTKNTSVPNLTQLPYF